MIEYLTIAALLVGFVMVFCYPLVEPWLLRRDAWGRLLDEWDREFDPWEPS